MRVLIGASLGLLITIGALTLICLGYINLENKVWAELRVKSVTAPAIHTMPTWKFKFFRGGEPNVIHPHTGPHATVCGNFGPYLVVANSGSGTVSMINDADPGKTPFATVNVPTGPGPYHPFPWFLAFNPYNGDWYVTDNGYTHVYVIHWDITPPGPPNWSWTVQGRIVTTVDVGGDLSSITDGALAYDPDNHYMYVLEEPVVPSGQPYHGTVSAIDPSSNTVVTSPITVGQQPNGIAYDPDNKYMYVVNGLDGTVSVIDPSRNTQGKTQFYEIAVRSVTGYGSGT